MLELPNRFRPNSDEVAAKVIDGEAIIINLTTGVYYSMDSLGGRIWSLIEANQDIDTIVATIGAEYEVTPERCRADVASLARQLMEEKLVLAMDGGPSGGLAQSSASGDGKKLDYTTPELNIYRDMGDLLALDPPIPGLEPIPWEDPTDKTPKEIG